MGVISSRFSHCFSEERKQREREQGIHNENENERIIVPLSSPHVSFQNRHSEFSWYDEDLWMEAAKHLDGRDLISLSMVNHWFDRVISEECIWKHAFLRDMDVPDPCHVSFPWKQIYSSAFDGSHSYSYCQQDKHICWVRIGAFFLDSQFVLLSESLALSRWFDLEVTGTCSIDNAKTGIWIADLHMLRCPVCNDDTCGVQVLDARHSELFLEEEYQSGTWDYEDIGQHLITSKDANGAIFYLKYLSSFPTAEILAAKSWVGSPSELQPRVKFGIHGVAVNRNLQPNDVLYVRYQVMRDNDVDGKVVSIRISHQLI